MRICTNKDCFFSDQLQPIENFYKNKTKEGFCLRCKVCVGKREKEYYQKNKEEKIAYQNEYYKENKEERKQYGREHQKQYYQENKTVIADRHRQYNLLHKEQNQKQNKQYRLSHRKEINEKNNQRRHEDLDYKIRCALRDRLRKAVKDNQKGGSAVADLMMSVSNFKLYLEERFYPNPDTGEAMTWDNYGYRGWHIDHIIPLSAFDLTNREEFLKACHYTNLRPMWAKQNWSDGARGMSRRQVI